MCCKTPRGVGLLWELPETAGLWGQHSTVSRVQWSDTRGTSGTKTPPGEIALCCRSPGRAAGGGHHDRPRRLGLSGKRWFWLESLT